LAGGTFNDFNIGAISIGGQVRNRLARLDPVTGLADPFNPNANNTVFSIAVQSDGKILVGGFFTAFAPNGGASVTRNRIARLETDDVFRVTAITRSGNDIVIEFFKAVAGSTYRLERKLALTDSDWQNVSGVNDFTAMTTGAAQITDPGAIILGTAFYRVRLLP
jgi:hypothetical protein